MIVLKDLTAQPMRDFSWAYVIFAVGIVLNTWISIVICIVGNIRFVEPCQISLMEPFDENN